MSNKPLKVIAGAPDRPLIIGDIEIPCYVLEDETRVLSQGGFLVAIGRSIKPTGKQRLDQPDNYPSFLSANNLKPFISNDLINSTTPIRFSTGKGGKIAYGYRAELLPKVCSVYLEARDDGVLQLNQKHIVTKCDMLLRALATVGIIALIDETTGYQRLREENALATILEKFISEELQPWTKTFPYEFYAQIFRLKDWPGPDGVKRPSVIGHYTNDFVYSRLAPGVLDELRKINPKQPIGERKYRHHQWFTPDIGHPKLKEHLAAVTALMRASANWTIFKRNLQTAFPKITKTMQLPLEY